MNACDSEALDARACAAASTRHVAALCSPPGEPADCGAAAAAGDVAGCPFALRSVFALRHDPAIEACIRMGYWWARTYRASCLAPDDDDEGVHNAAQQLLVDAASGQRPPDATPHWAGEQRLRTFTNASGLWPLRLVRGDGPPLAVSQVAVLPSDSYHFAPAERQAWLTCAPRLLASRTAPHGSGTVYNRSSPLGAGVLWPGVTLAPTPTAAAVDDTPWAEKADRVVWRGALRGCRPSAAHGGACRNRDADAAAADAPALSQASRWGAFAAFHASGAADVGFTSADPRLFNGSLSDDAETAALCRPRGHPALGQPGERSPCLKGRLEPAEQARAKILLVLDGASYPSNAVWPQLSGSVVMAPLSAYETFADVGMQPWVHFLPVRLDFADAEEVARWCFEHERRCRAIAEAGREHMGRCYARPEPGAPHLPASRFERTVEAIIVAHLLANAVPG